MKKKITYKDEPMEIEVIKDFLPPPSRLVPNDETVKVTISLNRASVEFFKSNASKHKTKYQKMIRRVLDEYANIYAKI
ncbi:MAG: CopG family transcriptional regulator [Desulfamplus sp.]|nr:CopG family transcriptional regulator [Desulfamplus sp.]